jgi:hypothetical protein
MDRQKRYTLFSKPGSILTMTFMGHTTHSDDPNRLTPLITVVARGRAKAVKKLGRIILQDKRHGVSTFINMAFYVGDDFEIRETKKGAYAIY